MDPLTIAAICTLILKDEAAITAVPPRTNCAAIVASTKATAAQASTRVHNDLDREAIARVAFAEAGNQGDRGIAAVVFTIINRLGNGRWGSTVSDVLNAPRQFEPVTRAGGHWRNLRPVPPARRARVDAIVSLALKGELADETGGALYFQNPTIVAQREKAGTVSRGLTHFGGQTPSAVIGDHAFYTGRGKRPQRRTTAVDQLAANDSADERQRAYIEAGGAIFGRAKDEGFDPASTWEATADDGAEKGDKTNMVDDRADEILTASAPIVSEDGDKAAAQDDGGMFVLSNGKTSTSPRGN
ncbi:cell wall hydrolase [Sphingobium baderi]|uniref:Cell wall hydrolase SleB domain-containing protein n=2 Tax=Sphingomonadaceae TaxID=41297 RepID=A0A0S3F644_9SPHN|nr:MULTISPECIES: cell wall hydrolase [Sphingomonadaceae]ALR23134.1 hypothetical protein ATN00_21765 [Sphingobium baderi]